MIALDLEIKSKEYEANINDPVVNPDGKNTDYFRGKQNAYWYASSEIKNCLKWHGLTE